MKKGLIYIFLVFSIFLALILSAGAIEINFNPPIILSGTADADTYPTVATDGFDTWIVTWHSSGGSSSNDTDIIISRSTDNGDTWATPVSLNNNASTDSDRDFHPSIATDEIGNWVAVWHTSTGWNILSALSDDNGVTWSDPTPIANIGRNVTARVTTDKAGRWMTVWYAQDGNHGTDWDIFYAISTDNGASWTSKGPLNQNASTDLRADAVPKIATDGSETWISVWRSTIDPGGTTPITDDQILMARSTDNGETWTEPYILNTNGSPLEGRDAKINLASDGSGIWVVVWESSDSLGNVIGSDTDILVTRSSDNGETWSIPAPLNSDANTDSHIDRTPDVTTDGSGNWISVWNSGGLIVYSYSMDNGANWTPPERIDDNSITGDGRPSISTNALGTWIIGWLAETGDFYQTEVLISKTFLIPPVITVNIDIIPKTCPNECPIKGGGAVKVAILGTADFDVYDIDMASVRLEGVAPTRSQVKDKSTPVSSPVDDCECTIEGRDGFLDLRLKFDKRGLLSALGEVPLGENIVLTLTGSMIDGTPIEGQDCIVFVKKGNKD